MRTTTYGTGQFTGTATQSSPSFLAAIAAMWHDYRLLRDLESVPFSVMKDIGFRGTEQMNAK